MVAEKPSARPMTAIGNFDGVHRGHQFLIEQTKQLAQKHGAPSAALVFTPHPRCYFKRDDEPFLLTDYDERERLLYAFGLDQVFSVTFDDRIAELSAQDFVRDVLYGEYGLGGVVTGEEFRFGKGRGGDVTAMKTLCAALDMHAYALSPLPLESGDDKVSSTAVRAAIREGDVARASRLLGRHWSVTGPVMAGKKLGRQLGFPTANIALRNLVQPRFGVYAVKVEVHNAVYGGVANFGVRPTLGGEAPLLEVHVFDFDQDIYGARLRVEFIDFIRPEMKFDGLEKLNAQIARDCEAAKKLLSA